MERRIDPVAPLDYVELQIFPSHNRYAACVSTSNIIEKVATGDLQQLLLHLPQVKDLSSKTSDSNFRILTPDDVSNADWFTTVTLTRFLNIAGSPDILSIGNEITQLEETRKFQLSLFAKAEVDMTPSFESKNELLRAVDSRLSELKQKLGEALNQATGTTCSPKDLSNLENFAHHFGAEDIRDSLQKFLELSQFPSSKDSTPERTVFATHTSQLNPPVKYSVSPAKAAQVERQSSTDSENSFSSEEEDQPSVERSRPVARSATPRRLASPMRRVQIGRAGPRRVATISIKSLNYFPSREKLSTQKDATCHASDEEEDSETPVKQNALRMSVQDKISLFENKQKEKAVETEKSKTVLTAPVANKAVLRRWSSGMSESAATQIQNDTINKTSSSNHDDGAPGGNTESLNSLNSETTKNNKSSPPKKVKADILNLEMENSEDESEEIYEKHPASIEWNQQKEAELNQLFKKMMENKPVRRHSVTNDNSKSKNNNPKEQRGGFYDHYNQKRDEKLRKEASGKKAEKESQFKEMEKFLDEKKAEMASTNITDSRKKPIVNKIKPQNSQKTPTQLLNTKKEASKGPIVKKSTTSTTNKLSPLPATRKSWPATPSPRPAGASPAKTPSGPASTNASLTRKPQTTSSIVRSSTKVEKSKPQPKTLKSTPPDGYKNIKTVKEKKQPTVTKGAPIAKSKSRTPVATPNAVTSATATVAATTAKPSFYNKVTKKSSVVPLETKPFLRKGTGIGPGVGPVVVKSKVVAQPEEQQPDNTGDMIHSESNNNQAVEVEATEITSQSQCQSQEMECEPTESCTESETQLLTPVKCEEPEGFIQNRFNKTGNDGIKKKEIEEESTISISPTAWVEIEENNNSNNQDEIVPCKESPIQVLGSANPGAPAGASSPRVRHSLFQMLLEETTSEADSCEWGNAQQPPAMVNQKDGPKGLKRLLKFARKSKADLNLSDGSSPSSIFRRG